MMTITNGFVKLRTRVLSPQHGANISLVFQCMSVRRLMDWELTKSLSGVSFRKNSANVAYPAGHGSNRNITWAVRTKYLTGETPHRTLTFINQFMAAKRNFPWGIPCDRIDSLYREAMVVEDSELRPCTI